MDEEIIEEMKKLKTCLKEVEVERQELDRQYNRLFREFSHDCPHSETEYFYFEGSDTWNTEPCKTCDHPDRDWTSEELASESQDGETVKYYPCRPRSCPIYREYLHQGGD